MEHLSQEGLAYETPQVVDFGDLRALTAQHQNGSFTDQAFPSHTPKGEITFS